MYSREASKFLLSALIQAASGPPPFPRVTPRGEEAQPVTCLTKQTPPGRSQRRPARLCARRGRPRPRPSPPAPARTRRPRPRLSRARRTRPPVLAVAGLAPPLGGHSPSATSVFWTGPKGRVIRPWGPRTAPWTALRFGRKLREARQRRPGPCACWARRALGCAHVAPRCLWCLVLHRLTKQRYLFQNPVTQFL